MMPDAVAGLEQAGWPVIVTDDAGGIRHANPAARNVFGPALEGAAPQLAAAGWPEGQRGLTEFISRNSAPTVPPVMIRLQNKDGKSLSCFVSLCVLVKDGNRTFVFQIFPQPFDQMTTSEATLLHKQKLDCALQLARTVSLDFNNALTSILGHTSLILSRMEPGHPWRSSLLEVEKSASKAAEIANDLGTFSRQEKESRAQASGNLNSLLQRTVEFFQQNASASPVTWKLQFERSPFAVKFDEAKMQQAFIKILENAIQALSENGHVTIQTKNLELREPTQDRNVKLVAGTYVCAEINDNGCGIEPEVLPRIFEPFFTTKRQGNHRGLGLAWVYGIITNHGGGVAVSSQPGVGTAVRVYLPAEKRIVEDKGLSTADLSGNQTILMVDDEDLLLTMGKTILSAYGYRVVAANSGQAALDALAQNGSSVDLVITDLVMPLMSGRELVEHIRRLTPNTRIICTSGYIWPAGQKIDGAYLQKPFTSQELLLKVKQVLAERPETRKP
jgi:two-component system, cell cycle sensor histidine kinase and response regulator CckA